jgi:hypothetical protein
MPKNASKFLQVFIGCPSDLAEEREAVLAAREHIERLLDCPIQFTTWKMSASGVGEPQQVIFDNHPVESFDIVVILLWSKLGVPSGLFDPRTKAEMTGTEAEFVLAYDLHVAHGGGRPQVLLYRCSRKTEIDPGSPESLKQMAQFQTLQEFLKQTKKGGLRPMLAQPFQTPEELKDKVTRDIKTAQERLYGGTNDTSAVPDSRPTQTSRAASSDEVLHRYFAALRDQFSIYENVGLPVPERDSKEGEKDAPLPIRTLFVEPACTESHFSAEAFDAELLEGRAPARPLLPRLAPPESRTVLLADPGMGKSTLIQWLISTLADEDVPTDAQKLRGAIPIPFILRDLVPHLPQNLTAWKWGALVDAFRQWRHRGKGAPVAAALAADDALFRSTLASESVFFLIDGLDEIGDPQRRTAIRNAIWEGFGKYPQARWLITSRIVGYDQAEVHKQATPVSVQSADSPEESIATVKLAELLHLAPFDDRQQHSFARNWYLPRLGEAVGLQRADDFVEAVRRHAHTRVISRVPNLLYLLALLFRHRARLPDGRALVYSAISSAYLADIDLGRRLPDALVVPWKFEEKEDLLALVAMRMQELRVAAIDDEDGGAAKKARGEILATRAQLETWLRPRFGGADDREARAELNRFLDHIANRSGLLLPRGEGIFGFAHLSFQEYYAACCLQKEFRRILNEKAQIAEGDIFGTSRAEVKKDEEKMFAKMAGQPAWRESLLFLVEKLRHNAPDTLTFIRWAFPQLAAPLSDDEPPMPFTAAQLLAGISLDQEVSLDANQREKLWTILWRVHIAQQAEGLHVSSEWHLAPSLLMPSAFQSQSLKVAAGLNPRRLMLQNCNALTNLSPLIGLNSLEELALGQCTALTDLSPLGQLASLKNLSLGGATNLKDLSPLAGLKGLRGLWLSDCPQVDDIGSLKSLGSLDYLALSCARLTDLKPLGRLSGLKKLVLDDCRKIGSLDWISGLPGLRWLSFDDSETLTDLTPLSKLGLLNTLWLRHCTALSNLIPIRQFHSLTDLLIDGCPKITDLKSLASLASLQRLVVRDCPGVTREAVATLQSSLPKLEIASSM